MADGQLKMSYMQKRSQMKSRFTTENYKHRWFVLTMEKLTYHDGSLDDKKPGKVKGSPILTKHIKAVEDVSSSVVSNKPHAFQIVYLDSKLNENYTLYVVAVTDDEKREWIEILRDTALKANADLNKKYHPSNWDQKKGHYTCCSSINKRDEGCQRATHNILPTPTPSPLNGDFGISRTTVNNNNSAGYGGPTTTSHSPHRALPPPPVAEKPKHRMPKAKENPKVIALYNYTKAEDGDLALTKGDEYEILDESHDWWWKVQARTGAVGYIPANYVEKVTSHGLEKYDWFYPGVSRQSSEEVLKRDSNEGCFMLRESNTSKGTYSLSILATEPPLHDLIVRHYHVKKNGKGDFYLNDKHSFPNIPDMIFYHRHNCAGLVVRLREPPADRSSSTPTLPGLGHDKFELNPDDIEMREELGSGQFGVVKHGIYKGDKHVAVKMMNERTMKEADFIDEAKTMMRLRHNYLVGIFGVCTQRKPILLVTEYMSNGALNTYLRRHKKRLLHKDNLDRLCLMCTQVSGAMQFLESQQFIHRDLAARNCLVGENLEVKVGDFGLARFVLDDEYTSSQGTKFPIKWAAPEVLQYTVFSSKSDVWAFGILMWEIFTGGDMPYGRTKNADVVEMVCTFNRRLEQPAACPQTLFDIMIRCWEASAEERPSFTELTRELSGIGDKDYVD